MSYLLAVWFDSNNPLEHINQPLWVQYHYIPQGLVVSTPIITTKVYNAAQIVVELQHGRKLASISDLELSG